MLKLFFLEKLETQEGNKKYKVYYIYARYKSGLDDKFLAGGGIDGGSENYRKNIPLVFDVPKPFYYLTDESLKLLDHEVSGGFLTWGDSSINFGQAGIPYGVRNANYEISFNTLTAENQEVYFENCEKQYQFTFADRYIKNQPSPEQFAISTTNSIGTTLTTNNITYLNTDGLDLETIEKSSINHIQLDITGGFAQDDWLEISNLNTNTGFRFEWKSGINSGSSLLINTGQIAGGLINLVLPLGTPKFDTSGNPNYNLTTLAGRTNYLTFNSYLIPEDKNYQNKYTAGWC